MQLYKNYTQWTGYFSGNFMKTFRVITRGCFGIFSLMQLEKQANTVCDYLFRMCAKFSEKLTFPNP